MPKIIEHSHYSNDSCSDIYTFDDGVVLSCGPRIETCVERDGVEIDVEDRDEYITAAGLYGEVNENDYCFLAWDHGVGYEVYLSDAEMEERGLDWSDVVSAIAENAEGDLNEVHFLAWTIACNAGRGPDADADVDGRRWVADDDDVKIAGAIIALRESVNRAVAAPLEALEKALGIAEAE